MGRKWTDEEKKAFGVKMKALRDAKAAAQAQEEAPAPEEPINLPEAPAEIAAPAEATVTNTGEMSTEEIMRKAFEAITLLTQMQANQQNNGNQGANVQNGSLVGSVTKYSLKPEDYPSPIERLKEEPRLQRFGFKENFDLIWQVTTSEYTTIDKIRVKEPKFILDLVRVIHDEETGEVTGGRYIEYRMVMHEDPDSALVIARQHGVNVDNFGEKAFLDEMRYLTVLDWIIECFYKAKPTKNSNRKEMVVNGKIVDFFEVSSENSSKIPFDQLESKL